MTLARRWSDNDRYLGPFTWSYSSSYRHLAIVLRSRGEEGGDGGRCSLRFSFRKATLIVALPNIVRPWRKKVYPNWDAATVQRLGRDWYWDVVPRQYGFSLSDGFLSVYFGRETHDSSTEQRWGYFLPWTQWRHVRHSLYGLAGEHFATDPKASVSICDPAGWEAWRAIEKSCPTAAFTFDDYDGQRLTATTRIEEREWHFGTGWFRWLSWFRRPKISRSLNLEFSDEVGPEKGSWKGGTIGHSTEMLPGELHEAAFKRYCAEEHRAKGRRYRIAFVGPA
jgi:hypothetical protein